MTHSFQPGDHLAVRRRWGYRHHGIFVSDERVIQFGGQISDKPGATIEVVSIDEFVRGGSVRAVRHASTELVGWNVRGAERPDRVVQKAEWLLEQHNQWLSGKRRYSHYNVITNNCEHAATFCATTVRAESLQVTLLFGLFTFLGVIPVLLGPSPRDARTREGRGFTDTLEWVLLALSLIGSLTARFHNFRHRRYWRRIFLDWLPIERRLRKRFDPGDHLITANENRVYHGIYVDDDRVIRFSRSYLLDTGPSIEAVPLSEFELEDEVTLIANHPGPPCNEARERRNSPEVIVSRAEALLAADPAIRLPGDEVRRRALEWCVTGTSDQAFGGLRLLDDLEMI